MAHVHWLFGMIVAMFTNTRFKIKMQRSTQSRFNHEAFTAIKQLSKCQLELYANSWAHFKTKTLNRCYHSIS